VKYHLRVNNKGDMVFMHLYCGDKAELGIVYVDNNGSVFVQIPVAPNLNATFSNLVDAFVWLIMRRDNSMTCARALDYANNLVEYK
jgi:hypothetical protein